MKKKEKGYLISGVAISIAAVSLLANAYQFRKSIDMKNSSREIEAVVVEREEDPRIETTLAKQDKKPEATPQTEQPTEEKEVKVITIDLSNYVSKPKIDKELINIKATRLNNVVLEVLKGNIENPNIKYYNVNEKMKDYISKNLKGTVEVEEEIEEKDSYKVVSSVSKVEELEKFIKDNQTEEGLTLESEEDIEKYSELKQEVQDKTDYITSIVINEQLIAEQSKPSDIGFTVGDSLYLTQKEYEEIKEEGWFTYKGLVYNINKKEKKPTTITKLEERKSDSYYQTFSIQEVKIDEENKQVTTTNINNVGKEIEMIMKLDDNWEIDDITLVF